MTLLCMWYKLIGLHSIIYYFTSYGLVPLPSVVVWPAAHLLPLGAACSLAGAPVDSSSRQSQPFLDKLFQREFSWWYSIDLSSSFFLLDTGHIISLVNSTESFWMDIIGWYFQAAILQLTEQTLYRVEQFYRFLPTSIQRPRRDLPTTTHRQTCFLETNHRIWQGRRRTSRPSLVTVATTTLLSVNEASPAQSCPSLSKRPVAITIVMAVVRFAIIVASACHWYTRCLLLDTSPFVFVRCDVLSWTIIIKP